MVDWWLYEEEVKASLFQIMCHGLNLKCSITGSLFKDLPYSDGVIYGGFKKFKRWVLVKKVDT